MAKVAFTIQLEGEKPRNRVARAMQSQGLGQRVMKDRRMKRRNRRSWRKDEARAW